MMKLSGLWIYPVKSLRGIALSEARVEARGLQHDRRWMIVDENGDFLTQRSVPKMAQINTAIEEDSLLLTWQNEELRVPLAIGEVEKSRTRMVNVWSSRVRAAIVGSEADEWFSEVLGRPCALVQMPERTKRRVDTRYAKNGEVTSFSDGFPFLIVGEASLADLNDKLLEKGGEPMEIERFRTNFYFSGGTPFEEDNWTRFKIGECEFEAVKGCSRCIITTLDPLSGQSTGREPLATLAKYRARNGRVYFAQNLLPHQLGTVRLGDELDVWGYRRSAE